jgi:hypothetical protein
MWSLVQLIEMQGSNHFYTIAAYSLHQGKQGNANAQSNCRPHHWRRAEGRTTLKALSEHESIFPAQFHQKMLIDRCSKVSRMSI